MKQLLSKIGWIGILVVIAVASFNFSVQAAEKKKIKMNAKSTQTISVTKVYLEDVPNHVLGLSMDRQVDRTSPDPDWDGLEMRGVVQYDEVDGVGTWLAYATYYHKNGDKSYVKAEGRSLGDGAFEGKAEFIGGTGKFKNIKGTLMIKGKGEAEELEGEVEY